MSPRASRTEGAARWRVSLMASEARKVVRVRLSLERTRESQRDEHGSIVSRVSLASRANLEPHGAVRNAPR